ncbi:MAG: hypothetical protein N3F67_00645 [Acidilobaceae archaeon]|nr:hypothetical protein [Acidilobaceae archaeon]
MQECRARKDFLRHIANRVFMNYADRTPVRLMEEIKERLARGEDKYKFSVYGGSPERLADFLSSEEWADIVKFAKNVGLSPLVQDILKRLAEEYRDCPQVASRALEALSKLEKGTAPEEPKITLSQLVNKLELYGLRPEVVEREEGSVIIVRDAIVSLELSVSEGMISYTISKRGKASTFEAVLAVLQKVREL